MTWWWQGTGEGGHGKNREEDSDYDNKLVAHGTELYPKHRKQILTKNLKKTKKETL